MRLYEFSVCVDNFIEVDEVFWYSNDIGFVVDEYHGKQCQYLSFVPLGSSMNNCVAFVISTDVADDDTVSWGYAV